MTPSFSSLKALILTYCLLTLTGCAAITITESGGSDFQYRPHFEESKPFFLWGIVGEHHINTQEICGARPVVQMQSKFSSWDVLYSVITLGIYLPRTAKVWCEREAEV